LIRLGLHHANAAVPAPDLVVDPPQAEQDAGDEAEHGRAADPGVWEAVTIASLLQNEDYELMFNVLGGTGGWKKAGLPKS
jgi:hypothetical protein